MTKPKTFFLHLRCANKTIVSYLSYFVCFMWTFELYDAGSHITNIESCNMYRTFSVQWLLQKTILSHINIYFFKMCNRFFCGGKQINKLILHSSFHCMEMMMYVYMIYIYDYTIYIYIWYISLLHTISTLFSQ